jgi:hypothetical protein
MVTAVLTLKIRQSSRGVEKSISWKERIFSDSYSRVNLSRIRHPTVLARQAAEGDKNPTHNLALLLYKGRLGGVTQTTHQLK